MARRIHGRAAAAAAAQAALLLALLLCLPPAAAGASDEGNVRLLHTLPRAPHVPSRQVPIAVRAANNS
jgi:hypothetical protein